MQVTVRAAKDNLSKLVEVAQSGEEVIIARGRKPAARIVAIAQTRFVVGLLKGRLAGAGPDFFKPMSEDESALCEDGR